jgi:hypothetical protein
MNGDGEFKNLGAEKVDNLCPGKKQISRFLAPGRAYPGGEPFFA